MSDLAGMFLRMATSGKPSKTLKPQEPQSTVSLKYCECAGMQTPHIHKPGHLECAWCLNKVYPQDTLRYGTVPKSQDDHQG